MPVGLIETMQVLKVTDVDMTGNPFEKKKYTVALHHKFYHSIRGIFLLL